MPRFKYALSTFCGLFLVTAQAATANATDLTAFEIGHNAGYEAGLFAGMERGRLEGNEVGQAEGYDSGWEFGYRPAYDAAFTSNHSIGLLDGWNAKYYDGFVSQARRTSAAGTQSAGVILHYDGNAGGSDFIMWVNSKFTPIHMIDDYQIGYDLGLAEGDSAGFESSYQPAYDEAFGLAYVVGTDEGTEQGRLDGADGGYRLGLEEGETAAEFQARAAAKSFIQNGGDLQAWMSQSDAFVAAAFAEEFPNVVIDALSSIEATSAGLAVAAVPEPSSFTLLFMAGLCALRARKLLG